MGKDGGGEVGRERPKQAISRDSSDPVLMLLTFDCSQVLPPMSFCWIYICTLALAKTGRALTCVIVCRAKPVECLIRQPKMTGGCHSCWPASVCG